MKKKTGIRALKKRVKEISIQVDDLIEKLYAEQEEVLNKIEEIEYAKVKDQLKQKFENKYFLVDDKYCDATYYCFFHEIINTNKAILTRFGTENGESYTSCIFDVNIARLSVSNILNGKFIKHEVSKAEFMEEYQKFKNHLLKIELTHGN